MRKQLDEVLQKNEQGGPSSNHEEVELPKMDSKDMLPSTMVNRSWKLLLKKKKKMEKYHNHLLKMIVVAMEPKISQ
jgi:hypothetical protein